MKRFICAVFTCLLLMLLPVGASAAEVASGTCGADLSWTLDDAGVLTISGTGPMTDYEGGGAPWFDYKDQITKIVLNSGITRIGNYAFNFVFRSSGVELEIDIPHGVTSIGENSFSGEDIVKVTLPDTVKTIEHSAFGFWCGRDGINIPDSVTEIGSWAFESCRFSSIRISKNVTVFPEHLFLNCSNLSDVQIPSGVTRIEDSAFQNCDSLITVEIPENVEYLGASVFFDCENLESVTFHGDAPVIAPEYVGAIFDRDMTAYYPAGNATWNTETLQDYNYETTTWIAYTSGEHAYGYPVFEWQEDHSGCSAVFVCLHCGDTLSAVCRITQNYIFPAPCREGKVIYTASTNLNGEYFEDVQEVIHSGQELVPHTSGNWRTDEMRHWKLCTVCGEILESADHTPGPAATQETSEKCTVCGYVFTPPANFNWFFSRLEDSYLWASANYHRIMEAYN